jgi:hypothetical protein
MRNDHLSIRSRHDNRCRYYLSLQFQPPAPGIGRKRRRAEHECQPIRKTSFPRAALS